MTINVRVIS